MKELIELASEIVSSYVGYNAVDTSELPKIIGDVYSALCRGPSQPEIEKVEKPRPAVPIKKSVTDNYIICLEDGERFKSLRRHLRSQYGMTPDEYREKWGLPADYPMVAPSYAQKRSELAKQAGLGRFKRKKK